jgi:WD40 repeat protein
MDVHIPVARLVGEIELNNARHAFPSTSYTTSNYVRSVATLGPDRIVSGSEDNTIKIWRTKSTRPDPQFHGTTINRYRVTNGPEWREQMDSSRDGRIQCMSTKT